MKYNVTITETLSKNIEIEAKTYTEAKEKAEDMYKNGEIVLSADDFDEVKIDVKKKKECKKDILSFIRG